MIFWLYFLALCSLIHLIHLCIYCLLGLWMVWCFCLPGDLDVVILLLSSARDAQTQVDFRSVFAFYLLLSCHSQALFLPWLHVPVNFLFAIFALVERSFHGNRINIQTTPYLLKETKFWAIRNILETPHPSSALHNSCFTSTKYTSTKVDT